LARSANVPTERASKTPIRKSSHDATPMDRAMATPRGRRMLHRCVMHGGRHDIALMKGANKYLSASARKKGTSTSESVQMAAKSTAKAHTNRQSVRSRSSIRASTVESAPRGRREGSVAVYRPGSCFTDMSCSRNSHTSWRRSASSLACSPGLRANQLWLELELAI